MHIYDQIRARIQTSNMWPQIIQGKSGVYSECNEFSRRVADLLKDIPDLSVIRVSNRSHAEHGWLIAHHPDVGFFMIDPTAAQFLETPKNMQYRDVFIGKAHDLEKLAISHGLDEWYYYWTPALKTELIYKPQEKEILGKFWSKYPYANIDFELRKYSEFYTHTALTFDDAGYNWRTALAKTHSYIEGEQMLDWLDKVDQDMRTYRSAAAGIC